ncbi:MAG: hypothetical protein HYW01_04220 [Deltaproteobacteria bacterium]|nr:hypothetical protein [Deltaproteobacteria bacterium]
MAIGYKNKKISVSLPLELYADLKQIAPKIDWTKEEILGWAITFGVDGVYNLDEMEKELSELVSRKKDLDLELARMIPDYRRLSSRNAALRYEYFELFSDNKTISIKLTGAKALNKSFKSALKILVDYNQQEEIVDTKIVRKYILKQRLSGN